MTLAPLRVARGMAAPASATAPPLVPTRPAVGSLRRGLAIPRPAVIPTHFVVGIHGWAPGGTRSLPFARLRLRPDSPRSGLGVKIGGIHAATAAFFAAGCRALWSGIRRTGFGWGRALGCGTRLTPPRAQPRLRSAFVPTRIAVETRLRAPHKPAEDGGFALALVRPRLPRPFFVQNRSLWGRKWPPQRNFDQKTGSEGAARPPATRPDPFRCAKVSGPLAFGGQPASRGLLTAPVTVPTARGASGLGAGLAARRGTVSQSPDIF